MQLTTHLCYWRTGFQLAHGFALERELVTTVNGSLNRQSNIASQKEPPVERFDNRHGDAQLVAAILAE